MTKTYIPFLLTILSSLKVCLVMTALSSSPSFAALSSCSGSFQGNSGSYGVKVKAFCENYGPIHWSLNDEEVSSTGGNFCLIAYKGSDTATACGDDYDDYERTMEDAVIRIGGDTLDGKFVLGGKIPVTIKLEGRVRDTFAPGKDIDLPMTSTRCICGDRENQYNLKISVSKEAILNSKITETNPRGNFTLTGYNETSNAAHGSIDFEISLELAPAFQISSLQDMTLMDDNGSASASQDFCVFAVGTEMFSLDANSTEGNNNYFRLKNGNNSNNKIRYSMDVGNYSQPDKIETYRGNNSGPTKDWRASNNSLCTNENMYLTININRINSNRPAGVYSDTMTLTVTPN